MNKKKKPRKKKILQKQKKWFTSNLQKAKEIRKETKKGFIKKEINLDKNEQ